VPLSIEQWGRGGVRIREETSSNRGTETLGRGIKIGLEKILFPPRRDLYDPPRDAKERQPDVGQEKDTGRVFSNQKRPPYREEKNLEAIEKEDRVITHLISTKKRQSCINRTTPPETGWSPRAIS